MMIVLIVYFFGAMVIMLKAFSDLISSHDSTQLPYIRTRVTILPWTWPVFLLFEQGRYIFSYAWPGKPFRSQL